MDLADEPDRLGVPAPSDLDFGEVDGEEREHVMELATPEFLPQALERVLWVFEVTQVAGDPSLRPVAS